MGRVGLAFRCFFRILAGKPVPDAATRAAGPGASSLPAPRDEREKDSRRAIQILGLLQKEGRLLDFLQEDIETYSDDQVGAAVRSIHAGCRRALGELLSLEPVLAGDEDSPVTVEPGFDPSTVRLSGNVTGDPPFNGVLRHHGWRAAELRLPELPGAGDRQVIAPAEVEV